MSTQKVNEIMQRKEQLAENFANTEIDPHLRIMTTLFATARCIAENIFAEQSQPARAVSRAIMLYKQGDYEDIASIAPDSVTREQEVDEKKQAAILLIKRVLKFAYSEIIAKPQHKNEINPQYALLEDSLRFLHEHDPAVKWGAVISAHTKTVFKE